jgi:glutathione S-transferase
MKLYYSPGACSLSPHIVLHEAGIEHEAVLAPTKTHKLPDGTDYYTINELGYVPLLELDSGERLREGPAIVQYLADQKPEKNLAPKNGTMARSHLQEWLNFLTSELHKGVGGLFNPAMPDEGKAVIKKKAIERLQWTDKQLEGKDYLMGDFTVADAYLFTIFGWTKGVGIDTESMPNLRKHRERMLARPAVQAAMKMEGLIK